MRKLPECSPHVEPNAYRYPAAEIITLLFFSVLGKEAAEARASVLRNGERNAYRHSEAEIRTLLFFSVLGKEAAEARARVFS